MVNEELNKEELNKTITEMLGRIGKVADVVDQVFPDKGVGAEMRESADKLKNYVQTLASKTMYDDGDILIDDLILQDETVSFTNLKKLAMKDCMATFKQLNPCTNFATDSDLKIYETLSRHARELFTFIVNSEGKNEPRS
jgi:hypothetical protein